MTYVLGLLVSIVGWYVGRETAHRVLCGHYVGWGGRAVGFIQGVVRSLFAIAPALGVFQFALVDESSGWIPFAVAIAYAAICGLLSKKNPNKSEIIQRYATIMGAFPGPKPSYDQAVRDCDEEWENERRRGWYELIGCVTAIGVAAVAWFGFFASA